MSLEELIEVRGVIKSVTHYEANLYVILDRDTINKVIVPNKAELLEGDRIKVYFTDLLKFSGEEWLKPVRIDKVVFNKSLERDEVVMTYELE